MLQMSQWISVEEQSVTWLDASRRRRPSIVAERMETLTQPDSILPARSRWQRSDKLFLNRSKSLLSWSVRFKRFAHVHYLSDIFSDNSSQTRCRLVLLPSWMCILMIAWCDNVPACGWGGGGRWGRCPGQAGVANNSHSVQLHLNEPLSTALASSALYLRHLLRPALVLHPQHPFHCIVAAEHRIESLDRNHGNGSLPNSDSPPQSPQHWASLL